MLSPEGQQIRTTLVNDRNSLDVPLSVQREEWQAAAAQVSLPPHIVITPFETSTLSGEWVSSANITSPAVLLYLHGGGYSAGSPLTHRELAARLSLASGVRLLVIDYRLAPEHPFPAAIEDAVAAYQWLLHQGIAPEQIMIGGDSAGGGLAMATLLCLRDQLLPLPAAAVLLSPWLDLALRGDSLQSRADLDPLCSYEGLRFAAKLYLGEADAQTALASPVYADLQGLPPLLIQVGDHEVLLSDSTRLAERARAAGVAVTLEVWAEVWHVWHFWAGAMPESQRAIARVGEFVRQYSTN